jgi:hypothetical protein
MIHQEDVKFPHLHTCDNIALVGARTDRTEKRNRDSCTVTEQADESEGHCEYTTTGSKNSQMWMHTRLLHKLIL